MRLIFDLKKKSILTKPLTKPELGTAPAPACFDFFVVFWSCLVGDGEMGILV